MQWVLLELIDLRHVIFKEQIHWLFSRGNSVFFEWCYSIPLISDFLIVIPQGNCFAQNAFYCSHQFLDFILMML